MMLLPRIVTSPASPSGERIAVGIADDDLDADDGLAGRLLERRAEQLLLVGLAGDERRGLGRAVEMDELRWSGTPARPRRRTSIAIGEPPCEKSRRLLTSRGRASCSSTAAATIVGTPSVAVTPSRSMTSSTSPGSNDGRMTCLAPTYNVCSTDTEPAAWNSGAMTRYTSSSVKRHDHLHVDGVGDQVAVGEDHALAGPGRAAGVEEAGGLVLVHRGVVERACASRRRRVRRTRRRRCGSRDRRGRRVAPGSRSVTRSRAPESASAYSSSGSAHRKLSGTWDRPQAEMPQ